MKAPAAARQATPRRVRPAPATISMGRRISTAAVERGRSRASDTYPLANSSGAVPFMTLGNAMSDADLKSFIDNLCTAVTNNNFPSVWVEESNENWNNGAGRISCGSQQRWRAGLRRRWGRNFSIMKTEAVAHCGSTVAAKIHYMIQQPGVQRWSYPKRTGGRVGGRIPDAEHQPVRRGRRALLSEYDRPAEFQAALLSSRRKRWRLTSSAIVARSGEAGNRLRWCRLER